MDGEEGGFLTSVRFAHFAVTATPRLYIVLLFRPHACTLYCYYDTAPLTH